MSRIRQLGLDVDAEFTAGSPFEATFNADDSGLVFSSPTVVVKTRSGDVVSGAGLPTLSASGPILSCTWSTTATAALNTTTGKRGFGYTFEVQALVDGDGPFPIFGGDLVVWPRGVQSSRSSSVATITGTVNVGGVVIAGSVLSGNGRASGVRITDSGNFYTSANVEGALQEVGTSLGLVRRPVVAVAGTGIDPTGTSDSTTAINALIAANSGAVFNFEASGPNPTFRITGPIIAGVPCTLRLGTALINQVTAARAGIRVTSSNVRIEGGTIQGPQFANNVVGERGIEILGPSAAAALSNVSLTRTRIQRFGEYGIYAIHLRDFDFDRPNIANIWYAGIMGLSLVNGEVWSPRIENIPADGVSNAYGISFSRNEVDSLATDPLPENITVHSPTVISVPTWCGVDTHGGKGVRFLDVDIRGCFVGAGIVSADGAGQVPMYGPRDCVITGTIDSGKTDGTAESAVWFSGVSAGNGTFPFATLATGVIDVTVKGHGSASSALGGAVYMRSTYGVKVTVRAERASRSALFLYYDNYAFDANVTAIDTWTTTGTSVSIFADGAGYNQGTVSNQTDLTSGTFTAAVLNAEGIRTGAAATNIVHVISQRSTATTPIVEGAGSTCRNLIATRATIANGAATAPSLALTNSPTTGLYRRGADQLAVAVAGAEQMYWIANALILSPGVNISPSTTTGTMFGVGTNQRIGFWGATPVPRPTGTPAAATDLATALTLVNDLRSKLISVGLIS